MLRERSPEIPGLTRGAHGGVQEPVRNVAHRLGLIVHHVQRLAWLAARAGLILAASVALIGGVAAGAASRSLSDRLMVVAFFIALPAALLGWLGLPEANRRTHTEESPS